MTFLNSKLSDEHAAEMIVKTHIAVQLSKKLMKRTEELLRKSRESFANH